MQKKNEKINNNNNNTTRTQKHTEHHEIVAFNAFHMDSVGHESGMIHERLLNQISKYVLTIWASVEIALAQCSIYLKDALAHMAESD